jgi:hypothetical protein
MLFCDEFCVIFKLTKLDDFRGFLRLCKYAQLRSSSALQKLCFYFKKQRDVVCREQTYNYW